MKILYWSFGVLIYFGVITIIIKLLAHINSGPDRRGMDRRQNSDDRRTSQRNVAVASRRIGDRRFTHSAIPA